MSILDTAKRLGELVCGGRLLSLCEYLVVSPMVRVFYTPLDPAGSGFHFYVTRWVCGGTISSPREGFYADPEAQFECDFHGVAYFDGVRHLFMGHAETDTEGYLYYPNLADLAGSLAQLTALEARFCSQPRRRGGAVPTVLGDGSVTLVRVGPQKVHG